MEKSMKIMICVVISAGFAGDGLGKYSSVPREKDLAIAKSNAVLERLKSTQPYAAIKSSINDADANSEQLLEFNSNSDEDGLLVSVQSNGLPRSIVLDAGGHIGRVVGITSALEVLRGMNMIVVVAASLSHDEDRVEYRMLVAFDMPRIDLVDSAKWGYSERLDSRDINDPYDGMSISFPGGDSVMIGLHDLTRGDGDGWDDRIESRYFVNHCPLGSKPFKMDRYRSDTNRKLE